MIDTVRVQGFRSIADSGTLKLGPVTVLLGPNNSGKSALLRALYLIQSGSTLDPGDYRLRTTELSVALTLRQPIGPILTRRVGSDVRAQPGLAFSVRAATNGGGVQGGFEWIRGQAGDNGGQLTNVRPFHFVVPVFAKRKPDRYESNISREMAQQVLASDRYLASRLASLGGEHDEGIRFRELLRRVVDVRIHLFLDEQGQIPGVSLTANEHISLDRMGEGISGVMALLLELASPGQRLFLIEEPEADLHPKALRRLLEVVEEAVEAGSQFVVSTHSDLVLRHLGSISGGQVYRTDLSEEDGLPTTTFTHAPGALDRLQALADLGFDAAMPATWLMFEESTAESLFRKVLIPLFYPRLSGVKTVSAGGAGNLTNYFNDLYRLILFVHLDDRRRRSAWVFVDGDAAGTEAKDKLLSKFPTWPADHFVKFSEPGIEAYYPAQFSDQVAALDGMSKQDRRTAKGNLVEDVCRWAASSPEARVELAVSASELLSYLATVENSIDRGMSL